TPPATPTWPRPSPRRPRTSTASSRWASTSSSTASSASSQRAGCPPRRTTRARPTAGRPPARPSATPVGRTADSAGDLDRGRAGAGGRSGPPLEHGEPAEARRIEQGVGLGDPAASRDGGQVADVRPLPPGPAGILDQPLDAVGPQPLGLGG